MPETPGELAQSETPHTQVVTYEGGARSGKGTTVRTAAEIIRAERQNKDAVLIIDQGLKFRALTYIALQRGLDLSRSQVVDEYLQQPDTASAMLDFLAEVNDMSDDDRDDLLYTPEIHRESAQVGSSPYSHPLAVELMFTQVAEAAGKAKDAVFIDGRSIEKYAKQMQVQGLARHVLSIYFQCDSMVAARRDQKLFEPWDDLTDKQKLKLAGIANDIALRNYKDMRRSTDPLRYPGQAFNLDFLRFREGSCDKVLPKIKETNRIFVDTTPTASIEHMTTPLVQIVKKILAV